MNYKLFKISRYGALVEVSVQNEKYGLHQRSVIPRKVKWLLTCPRSYENRGCWNLWV